MRWLLCIVFVLLCPARALAAYTPPPIAGHVTDAAQRLTPAELGSLNDKLARYRTCSTNHIAVFFPKSLEGNSIEDVAYATFNGWKVGEAGKDNGVLLVLATNERKVRIETGKGVGGAITDIDAAHILRDDVNPNLKENRFFAAADRATTSIAIKLGGCVVTEISPSSVPPSSGPELMSPERSLWYRIPFTLGAALFIALACLVQGNRSYAAGLGLGTLVALFLLLTYPARSDGLDSKGYLIVVGSITNVVAFVIALMSWLIERNGRGSSGDGSAGGYAADYSSGYGSSDYSSGGGGSDYSGGGGSSGGGGASDSY